MNSLAPIALFVYARPDHTRLTVESLKKNISAAESDLIIYSDAARNAQAAPIVQQVRDYLKEITGFRSVTVIERDRNYGLAPSIIDGVTSIVQTYGKVIVVEDDLVTSKYFLQYMNEGLSLYENDNEVISIHGYVYPVRSQLPETFFLCGAVWWGWGTWKRGWDLFEPDGRKLMGQIRSQHLERSFDWDGQYGNVKMLQRQISGKVNSWAIRWHASAFLQKKLTLFPGRSLVNNIGGDNLGTHTKSLDEFQSLVSDRPVMIQRLPLRENEEARKAFVEFFKNIRQPFLQKVIRRLISVF